MAEDGEPCRVVRGIDPSFECYPIRGRQGETLRHVSSWNSQMAAATRMTTARTADATSNQRVCMGKESNGGCH